MDDEPATLDGQFYEFSKFMDNKRDGTTITLYRSDFWMRQCKILEDRKLTMTDTGLAWWKYSKSELNYKEWYEFLTDVCTTKCMNQELVELMMTNCGLPGSTPTFVPQYRDFFKTYKPKEVVKF